MYVGPLRGALGDYSPGAPSSADRVVLGQIPSGAAGTRETLKIMRQLARASVRNPDQIVRSKARDILSGLPPRQWMQEIRALHSFVRDQIRYLRDPVTVELVQTPEKTLEYGQGDCDDKATLLAALLDSVGHPVRFVALAFGGEPRFSHVLVETAIRDAWLPLETIIQKEPGWYPENVTKRYVMGV